MIPFNLKQKFKEIVLNSNIKNTYNKKHTNSKYSLDLIIDELFYFLKSGVSWRFLRSPINYKTLFWHFSLFTQANIFLKLYNFIKKMYLRKHITKNNLYFIDSTSIYNKDGVNKIGRNKFYKNKNVTKLSCLTDINGFPISILFMKGNYHDNTIFNKHIRDAVLIVKPNSNSTIIADKAYSSKNNYTLLESFNLKHIIPPRKNMKIYTSYKYDQNTYIKRLAVEHLFAKFKHFKKINARYDKTLRNFKSFIYLACVFIFHKYI